MDQQVLELPSTTPCEKCGDRFTPRSGSGGRPQKFCTEECRRAADADRKANAKPEAQRADVKPSPPLVEPLPERIRVQAA